MPDQVRQHGRVIAGVLLGAVALVLLGVVSLQGRTEPARAVAPTASPTVTAAPESRQSFSPAPKPSPTEAKPTPSPNVKKAGLRIAIPSIGLDHRMSGGGVDSEGKINPDPGTVMWFKGFDRVRPGRVGTAVIAGHVATGDRRDVFADLADVDVGDTVKVSEDGRTITYRVTRASAIDKYAVTADEAVWGANGSRSRLAIITCDDAFGFRSDGHRKANFVVIAERV